MKDLQFSAHFTPAHGEKHYFQTFKFHFTSLFDSDNFWHVYLASIYFSHSEFITDSLSHKRASGRLTNWYLILFSSRLRCHLIFLIGLVGRVECEWVGRERVNSVTRLRRVWVIFHHKMLLEKNCWIMFNHTMFFEVIWFINSLLRWIIL